MEHACRLLLSFSPTVRAAQKGGAKPLSPFFWHKENHSPEEWFKKVS